MALSEWLSGAELGTSSDFAKGRRRGSREEVDMLKSSLSLLASQNTRPSAKMSSSLYPIHVNHKRSQQQHQEATEERLGDN